MNNTKQKQNTDTTKQHKYNITTTIIQTHKEPINKHKKKNKHNDTTITNNHNENKTIRPTNT